MFYILKLFEDNPLVHSDSKEVKVFIDLHQKIQIEYITENLQKIQIEHYFNDFSKPDLTKLIDSRLCDYFIKGTPEEVVDIVNKTKLFVISELNQFTTITNNYAPINI